MNSMDNIWRFYDWKNGISGFCIGATKEEATNNAVVYLINLFKRRGLEIDMQLFEVWNSTLDDDYREDFPFALTVNYV